jgi:hypothetical protein
MMTEIPFHEIPLAYQIWRPKFREMSLQEIEAAINFPDQWRGCTALFCRNTATVYLVKAVEQVEVSQTSIF